MNKLEFGISKNVDIELYHKSAGISSSGIKLILESAKKYHYHYISGLHQQKDTKALIMGSAVHLLALEPEKFIDYFTVLPEGMDRRRKEDKALFESLSMSGKKLLKSEDFREASSMAFAIRSNKAFLHLITAQGHIEDSLCWEDEGAILRSRPDFYNDFLVVDIKTTDSADRDDFQRSIVNYGYHIQAPMQLDGLSILTGKEYKNFCFLAVEKEPPYLNAIYLLSDEDIEIGRKLYKKGAYLYKKCLENDDWPGYPEMVQPITLPAWYINKFNNVEEHAQ